MLNIKSWASHKPAQQGTEKPVSGFGSPFVFLRITARSSILCIQHSANFSKILWPNGPYNMFTAQNTKKQSTLYPFLGFATPLPSPNSEA